METKLNFALVGLFVILLGAALVATIIWLVVGTEKKVYDQYRVYISESVSGLNPKAVVKFRGVEVGRVARIELEDPERVKILLDIEQGTPIRQDTEATLQVQGLTGLAYLELSGGSRHSKALLPTPEDPVPAILSGPSLVARLDDAFTSMLATFGSISRKLEILLGEDNQVAVQQILADVATITGSVAARSETLEQTLVHIETITGSVAAGSEDLEQTLADLHTSTAQLAARSATLGQAVDGAAKTMDNSARVSAELIPLLARVSAGAEAVEDMAQAISKTSQSLTSAVEDSRKQVLQLASDTAPELNTLLLELGQLADTMRRFLQDLEQNPRMLLLGKPSGRLGPGE